MFKCRGKRVCVELQVERHTKAPGYARRSPAAFKRILGGHYVGPRQRARKARRVIQIQCARERVGWIDMQIPYVCWGKPVAMQRKNNYVELAKCISISPHTLLCVTPPFCYGAVRADGEDFHISFTARAISRAISSQECAYEKRTIAATWRRYSSLSRSSSIARSIARASVVSTKSPTPLSRS